MRLTSLFPWISLNAALLFSNTCDLGRPGSVTGTLVAARSTGESVPAAVATFAFRNDSTNAIKIQSYRLKWPGGTFFATPKNLKVPARSVIERTARLDLGSGDIATLLARPQQVKLEVTWRASGGGGIAGPDQK